MASPQTEQQIEAQRRLRLATAAAVAHAWSEMESYDDTDVPDWLGLVVPLVLGAQRAAIALTDAAFGVFMGRAPLGIDPAPLTGAGARNGTPPEEVYRRPFVDVWTALRDGHQYDEAVSMGQERATSTAETDVQLAMRAGADAIEQADPNMFGFHRAADPDACKFCQLVDGAYVKRADAMALHNRCGCGLEPNRQPHPLAARLPSGVAVHKHGELGPVLTDPDHNFRTEGQALALTGHRNGAQEGSRNG
jgi:hypothetical protein